MIVIKKNSYVIKTRSLKLLAQRERIMRARQDLVVAWLSALARPNWRQLHTETFFHLLKNLIDDLGVHPSFTDRWFAYEIFDKEVVGIAIERKQAKQLISCFDCY